MKPVVILGAAGQLGVDLAKSYAGKAPLERFDRSRLDVTDRQALEKAISALNPSLVLNCAAYNAVDAAEKDAGPAAALNAEAVRLMAEASARAGATFAHFSTDYVFSGKKNAPYSESDSTEPLSAYGRSKLAGEQLAALNPKHFIFRVCGLYGVAGRRAKAPNFVERMLSLAGEKRKLRVVDDQRLTPSYTLDVAKKVWQTLEKAEPLDRFGVYHVTNSGSCTWFEFAQAIFAEAGVEADLEPTTLAAFAAPAPRPPYSVLAHSGLKDLGLDDMPHWKDGLKRYLEERRP